MRAVRMVARAEMRRRWVSIGVLTLLVGVVGAVVLASAAGARRTSSALTRFQDDTDAADVEFDVGDPTPAQLAEFRALPDVADVARLRQLAMFVHGTTGTFLPLAGQLDDRFGRTIDRAQIVHGRAARAANELTIGEALARQLHLGVGDTITFDSFSPAQVASHFSDIPPPEGPSTTFDVVGIVRRPLDLGGRGAAGGVVALTRPFVEQYRDQIGSFSGTVLRVRTEHGQSDVPSVVRAARQVFGDAPEFSVQGLGVEGQGAQSGIDVAATGLWVLAAVAAVAGLVAIGLAVARHLAHVTPEQPALRALGLRPVERWAAAAAGAVPVALAGAVLAVVAAVLASPLFPIAVARDAEPDPGIRVDALVVGLGALVMVVMVLALAAATAWGAIRLRSRASARPALPTEAMARAGVPPVVATGAGFALERGRGRSGIPVRSSLAGAVVGVLAAVAALTFAASLDHLVSTPAAYGWTFDYSAEDVSAVPDDHCTPVSDTLLTSKSIAAVSRLCELDAEVDGHPVLVSAYTPLRGSIGPAIVEGRAPDGAHQVALGADTLAAIGRDVGDHVVIEAGRSRETFEIVGRALGVSVDDPAPLADAAVVTEEGIDRLGGTDEGYLAVRLARDVDHAAAYRELRRLSGPYIPRGPILPTEVEHIRQIDVLPTALAAFVAFVALVAVGYALVIAVRRRQRDLAILKTLGFGRGQVRGAIAWQATTLALVGVVIGIPVGIVVGRLAWRLVADGLGVSTHVTVPVAAVLATAVAALVLANLIAWFPARTAARTRPAVVLRSE